MLQELKRTRYSYISFAKVIGITGVTLYHCIVFFLGSPFVPLQAGETSKIVIYINPIFDALFVPGFMLCSGFLFAKGAKSGKRSYGKTLWERLTRLLIPYYVVGTVWLVPMYTIFDIPCYGRPEHAGFLEGFKAMLLGQFSDHLWFLWGLFWATLLFCLLLPLCRNEKLHPILFVIITAVSVLEQLYITGIPYFKLFSAASYNWVFFVGMICYYYRFHFFNIKRPILWGLLAATVMLLVALLYAPIGQNLPEAESIQYKLITLGLDVLGWLKYAAGGFTIFLIAVMMERYGVMEKFFQTKVWDYTFRHNMDLYLFNLPLPHLFFMLFYQKLHLPMWPTIILITVCTFPSLYLLVGVVGKLGVLIRSGFSRLTGSKVENE